MKLLITIGILLLILVTACEVERVNEGADTLQRHNTLQILKSCQDGVICYWYEGGYSGGMSCLRDDDLVDKYCPGDIQCEH